MRPADRQCNTLAAQKQQHWVCLVLPAEPRYAHHVKKGITMPSYHVEMMEGRTVEQKKKLVEAITRVSVEILGGVADSVDIIITDVKRENWATGGKLWSEPRD